MYRKKYTARSTFGRKSYGRKPRASPSGYAGYASMARKALNIASSVAKLVNVEHKYIDTIVSGASILNTAYRIDPITLCAEGDDMTNRNGRSIKISDIDIRLQAQQNASAKPVILRCMLLRDNACSGANPVMTDVVQSTIGADTAVNDFRNLLTGAVNRYDILWDKRIELDAAQSTYTDVVKHWDYNEHVRYVGIGGTITSAGNGSLFLCFIGTGATGGTTDGSTLQYTCRVKFIDN